MADRTCGVDKLVFEGAVLRICLGIHAQNVRSVRVFLRYRAKLAAEVREYEGESSIDDRREIVCTSLSSSRCKKRSGKEISSHKNAGQESQFYEEVTFDLTKIDFTPLYYDLMAEITTVDGQMSVHEVHYGNFNKKVRNPFYHGEYRIPDSDMFFYPYIHNEMVSFCYRKRGKYDTISFRLKEIAAVMAERCLHKKFSRQPVCLIYEKYCFGAQDNGYYFFKYCMEHGMEKELGMKIFYVIDRNSPDKEKLKPYEKNVLTFMSFRHMVTSLGAKLLVSTDTKEHLYAWRKRHSIITGRIKKKPLVFLQHGVIALKKVENAYQKGSGGQCDLFIVSSDREKDIIHTNYGYDIDEIAVTGLARWDVLKDKSQGKKQILFMATWRNFLDEIPEEEFVKSQYFKTYLSLLTSEKLRQLLEKYCVKVKFYVHNKFKEYARDFMNGLEENGAKNPWLEIMTFEDAPLNELLMESNMLVTDYSSVSFDMFYQNKPVVFYQFDSEQYLEAHGSYLDFDKELFGDRAKTEDELLKILEEYMRRTSKENGFYVKEEFAGKRRECFKYTDQKNCERIADEIKHHLPF